LEGQESYTKIYLLTLLYKTKLEERSLDFDGYVKSTEAILIRKRLNDVNLELLEKFVVLMTLLGIPLSFQTQRKFWNLERTFPWRLSEKTCDKKP